MVLGYQTGGQTTTGSLHPDPTRRWRCLYIDEIDNLTPAHPASGWVTPHNYNPTQPFPAGVVDQLAIAITPHPAPRTHTRVNHYPPQPPAGAAM